MDVMDIVKEELEVAKENLKAEGLDLAEEVLLKVFNEVNGVVKRTVVKTETKIDDLYLVVEGEVSKVVAEAIDKIDGEEG
tara:strand:- start:10845 stop:11084 length:240 start_codon:yes stop_codon:yes gene_type:complete